MKEWTFLLQQYGDRSWLPLDSPDVEILEGRYRIVVQTDHPNTDINIRICHLATEEEPPKRRIQKRTNCTNANGLMVVAPFTHLQPGNWELSCFLSDPMSDLVGDMLHHAVRLRVAANIEQEVDDWDESSEPSDSTPAVRESAAIAPAELQSTQPECPVGPDLEIATPSVRDMAALNVEIAQALGFSMDRLVEMTDQLSHKLIEEIFQEFNLAPVVEAATIADSDTQPEVAQLPSVSLSQNDPAELPEIDVNQLRIALAQDCWMASRGEPLTISGRLELAPAIAVEPTQASATLAAMQDSNQLESELEGVVPQEIQIQLRDPQTSKVMFHACQSFPVGVPPMPFTFLCNLPDDLTTHLLLGEVTIAGVLPGAESVLVTLKTFNFTVTVDPQGLVAELQKVQTALADQVEQDELLDVVAQFSERLQKEKERQSLDLSFLNMAAPVLSETAQAEAAMVAAEDGTAKRNSPQKQILPPQLYTPDVEQAGKRKLELPVFAGVGARAMGASVKTAITTHSSLVEDSEPVFGDRDLAVQSMVLPDFPPMRDLAEMSPDRDGAIAQTQDETPATPAPADASATHSAESAPVAQSGSDGQADLAMIDELTSPIRSAFQALNLQDKFLTRLSSMAADTELTTLLKLTLPQTEDPEVEAAEVAVAVEPAPVAEVIAEPNSTEVVVDDDPAWRDWLKRAGSRKVVETPVEVPGLNPLLLPADQPVPLPTLELGIDEIVAGKPIHVRIKLPNLRPKIYVKLWINDRQTRTMLDGPRWLVDFLPNGFDELETSTQITAPFGSLNIRLEAIAVEIQTQRESQKVSLDCEVLPADLPDELFDEFEY